MALASKGPYCIHRQVVDDVSSVRRVAAVMEVLATGTMVFEVVCCFAFVGRRDLATFWGLLLRHIVGRRDAAAAQGVRGIAAAPSKIV